jgi:hypothetical protein
MKYRNLTVIMIDEISMVGNEMFSLLESRLKKIKENKQAFGGVSVIVIGDLLQLKPVCGNWIFNDLHQGIACLAPGKHCEVSHHLCCKLLSLLAHKEVFLYRRDLHLPLNRDICVNLGKELLLLLIFQLQHHQSR